MGFEILFLVIASYALVAPDKHTLKLRSGVAGAVRGMVKSRRSGSTSKAAPAKKSPTKGSRRNGGKRPAAGGTNLFSAARAGWREGVRTAQKRRAEGRDTWSRTVRAGRRIGQGAGRLAGGTGSVFAGVRDWRRDRAARRATEADFEVAEGEHLADVIVLDPAAERAEAGRRATATDRARFAAGGGGDTGVVFLDRSEDGVWPGHRPTTLDGRAYGSADCACAACEAGFPEYCRWRDSPEQRFIEEESAAGRPIPDDHGVLRTTPHDHDGPAEFMIIDPDQLQPPIVIDADGVHVGCKHYPVNVDGRRFCGICGTDDLDQLPTNEKSNQTRENAEMSDVTVTELESLSSVQAETEQGKQVVAAMAETFAAYKSWASSLSERWSSADWATNDLDSAIAAVSESAPTFDPEGPMAALTAMETAVEKARSLGEVAAAQGARGRLDAFNAS